MSKIGFYRYKIENATDQDVTLFINGVVSAIHNVKTVPVCSGYKTVKFLDRNGQYRFYSFVAEHGIKDKPKEIGKVNELITSLLTNQTDRKSAGYTNERTITLRASLVSADELEILSDIYTSPRVYYYVGDGTTDDSKDWVLVSVTGDGVNRRDKKKFGKVEITLTLPTFNTITIL